MRVKSASKRNAIALAAMEVFLERGFESASMNDIAKREGCSKATLYSYFPSKDELFAQVMDHLCSSRFEQAFGTLVFDGDLHSTLKHFGVSLLTTQLAPDLLAIRRIAIAEGARSGVGRLFYERGPRIGLKRIEAFVVAQMAAGRLRRNDSWQATIHLVTLLEGDFPGRALLGVVDELTAERIEAQVEQAVTFFLTAYRADPPT